MPESGNYILYVCTSGTAQSPRIVGNDASYMKACRNTLYSRLLYVSALE